MDDIGSPPGSPPAYLNATPLQPLSPDRANLQNSMFASMKGSPQRDGDVHGRIRQFNNLTHLPPAGTSMSKQLERMTADAAPLKRAMIGREEAESEMRRYKEESRLLRKQIEEGRERERKVGERLETVMENYGRAKETYSHTQAIWEKEIRRARKETFKSQSSIVKLQEDLKAARVGWKSAEESFQREKESSKAREQETVDVRHQLATSQEELRKAQERIAILEEEKEALRTAAKGEEIARIAAEARIPLPPENPKSKNASTRRSFQGRESLSTYEMISSAVTEDELEELTRLWQWEKQRADRTQDHLDFIQAEVELYRSNLDSSLRRSTTTSPRRNGPVEIVDPSDLVILGQSNKLRRSSPPARQDLEESARTLVESHQQGKSRTSYGKRRESGQSGQSGRRESRRSTIFVPAEGIFRTVSQQDIEVMEQDEGEHAGEGTVSHAPTQVGAQSESQRYARTPSVEPPTFAMMVQERTSLLSLLNAPRGSEGPIEIDARIVKDDEDEAYPMNGEDEEENAAETTNSSGSLGDREAPPASLYTVTTTTTTIPVHDENTKEKSTNSLTLKHGRTPSFDVNNPALTPTMTREEALAQIRERRGRARSAMQGAMTPRKQMVTGVVDRNVSAPAGPTTKGRS